MDQQTEKNLLDLVKRNYEEIAADFDITRKSCFWPELAKIADSVKNGDRVLDAGCGNGRLLEMLSGKKIEYLGIDSSQELVKIAQVRFPDKIFLLGDILELDRAPEKGFDYVFCIAVLHHLPGESLRVAALRQMKNKLQPASAGSARGGGKIIITVWNLWQAKFRRLIFKFAILKIFGKSKMDFGDILFSWKNKKGEEASRRYYHAFIKSELKKIASQAGLKINELYKDKFNYYLILE